MARRLFVLLVPLVLLAGACSKDDKKEAASSTTTTSTTMEESSSTTNPPPGGSSTTQTAPTSTTTPPGDGIPMTGKVGSGTVTWSASAARSELCYRITVSGIGTPSEASLRRPTGESVLELQAPPADGTVNTCSATDALTVEEINTHPGNFLVQVTGTKGVLKATLR